MSLAVNSLVFSIALTTHIGYDGDYNNVIPHLKYKGDEYSYGVFVNSEGSLSAYGGLELDTDRWTTEFGLTTGYQAYPIVPYIRSTYRINDGTKIFFTPAPEAGDDIFTTGLVIGIEYRIK